MARKRKKRKGKQTSSQEIRQNVEKRVWKEENVEKDENGRERKKVERKQPLGKEMDNGEESVRKE